MSLRPSHRDTLRKRRLGRVGTCTIDTYRYRRSSSCHDDREGQELHVLNAAFRTLPLIELFDMDSSIESKNVIMREKRQRVSVWKSGKCGSSAGRDWFLPGLQGQQIHRGPLPQVGPASSGPLARPVLLQTATKSWIPAKATQHPTPLLSVADLLHDQSPASGCPGRRKQSDDTHEAVRNLVCWSLPRCRLRGSPPVSPPGPTSTKYFLGIVGLLRLAS